MFKMFKILIPILFFFTFFSCAIAAGRGRRGRQAGGRQAGGRRVHVNINPTVSNVNTFERRDNHEYNWFCVYMACQIPQGNHVFGVNYVQKNVDNIIDAPRECMLDHAITFYVTHAIRHGMRGQYCFADGGSHHQGNQQGNYNNWPQTQKIMERYAANDQHLEGYFNINYVTRHSLDEPTPTATPTPNGTQSNESEGAGSVPSESEYNGSDYNGSE